MQPGRHNRQLAGKLLLVVFILGILGFALLRLVNLAADPPEHLTSSGVLYTDEGWYSRNALSHYLGGPWIIEGDFNPIINMPVVQIVNYAVFNLAGSGLGSARMSGALAFLATLAVLYVILNRRLGRWMALTVLLLLSGNYLVFAFSRVAVAENIMMLLIVTSFYFALESSSKGSVANAVIAAFFFVLALLTKMIAVFFLPVMVFIFWCGDGRAGLGPSRDFLKKIGLSLGLVLALLAIYFFSFVGGHMEDFRFFNNLNIASRIKPHEEHSSIARAFYVLKGSSLKQNGHEIIIYMGGLLGCIYLLLSRRLRSELVLMSSAVWVLCYMGIVAANGYAPPRYYIPVMIPLTVIAVSVAFYIKRVIVPNKLSLLFAIAAFFVLGSSFAMNVGKIAGYIASPKYTFRDASRKIGLIIRGEDIGKGALGAKRGNELPGLLGHFANSISLEARVLSYNDTYNVAGVESIMERYRPGYYVCYGPVEEVKSSEESFESADFLRRHFSLRFISSFDVLGNYYKKKPVYLYRIEPRDGKR